MALLIKDENLIASKRFRYVNFKENIWRFDSSTDSTLFNEIPIIYLTPDELSEQEIKDLEEGLVEIKSGKAKHFKDLDEAFKWLEE